ncbi:MAG: lamin tail domain-containing protein [Phycisphaerae bacterium]
MKKLALVLAVVFTGQICLAQMYITEWMYQGTQDSSYEFIEFTNMSTSAIDMTGWSFDDDHQTPGAFDLSGFGIVQPGQSVILTEVSASDFRDAWGLDSSIKVVGDLGVESGSNLGRADEINLYDSFDNLVDRLTYGDSTEAGGPRTRYFSGNILLEYLGQNDATQAVLSANGDIYGSYISNLGDAGNPGSYYAAIPEPASLILFCLSGLAIRIRMRRN